MKVYQTDCFHFDGYKPCVKGLSCTESCVSYKKIQTRILIVHLGALGAVARATALLPSMQKKYPHSHITWVTEAPADSLLKNIGHLNRVFVVSKNSDMLELSAMEFDVAFVIDKSPLATGVIKQTKVKQILGFIYSPQEMAILPANTEATELWELGLDNKKKFFENKKTELQLMAEAFSLPWQKDPYQIALSHDEAEWSCKRRSDWLSGMPNAMLLGFNIGCAPTLPNKKPELSFWLQLLLALKKEPIVFVILGGGEEDVKRANALMAAVQECPIGRDLLQSHRLIVSPMQQGIRDGMISVKALDMMVTGDSLGMHLAIGLGVYVAAWFGPSCEHEIEFFNRGVSWVTQLSCAPCWKRSCDQVVKCNESMDINIAQRLVLQYLKSENFQSRNKPLDELSLSFF